MNKWAEIDFNEDGHIVANPTRMLAFHKNNKWNNTLTGLIHRAIFLLRARMHFCMLWDTKIQCLYQNLNSILRDLESKKVPELFECLRKITLISQYLSSWSTEIFSSFVWRYSSFLATEKGYLLAIFNELDKIMTTTHKSEDLRISVSELRKEIEFVSDIIREKIAEKFPEFFERKNDKTNC